jgi:ankyrin repeat protein
MNSYERSPYSTLDCSRGGYVDLSGLTRLQVAVSRNRFNVVEDILAKRGIFSYFDPKIDEQNNEGDTALIMAVKTRAWSTVKLLLSYGVNPNIQNYVGQTALHMCSKRNMLDMITELMSHGANPNIRDINGDIAENLTDLSAVKECIEEEARRYLIRTEHERLWFDM